MCASDTHSGDLFWGYFKWSQISWNNYRSADESMTELSFIYDVYNWPISKCQLMAFPCQATKNSLNQFFGCCCLVFGVDWKIFVRLKLHLLSKYFFFFFFIDSIINLILGWDACVARGGKGNEEKTELATSNHFSSSFWFSFEVGRFFAAFLVKQNGNNDLWVGQSIGI